MSPLVVYHMRLAEALQWRRRAWKSMVPATCREFARQCLKEARECWAMYQARSNPYA